MVFGILAGIVSFAIGVLISLAVTINDPRHQHFSAGLAISGAVALGVGFLVAFIVESDL